MPGYVIHLAVAEQYLRKNKKNVENYDEFIEGVIFPDSVKDKSLTHYGNGSSNSNLFKFLEENKLENSFKRGYFLHLLTDYLFYNKYIEVFSKDIYNDYDILNLKLINKYKVALPEKIKQYVFFKEGELKILSYELVEKLIEEISDMNIDEIEKDVKNDCEKWTKIRELKHI